MGLFDIIKNVKEEPKKQNVQHELPFDVAFSTNQNGTFQVDFYDRFPGPKQYYDTTRLVVDPNPLVMNNQYVLNGAVSWYGRDDTIFYGNKGQEYRGILAQIDLNLLQTDANYCYVVMKQLLKKDRVESYLSQGLEENPKRPCGKYIGGVAKSENQYKKIFDENLGRESHYSDFMVKRRQEIAREHENYVQQQIYIKQEQIKKLQEEIDNIR